MKAIDILYMFKAKDQASKVIGNVGGAFQHSGYSIGKANKANTEYSQSTKAVAKEVKLLSRAMAGLGAGAGLLGLKEVLDTAIQMDNQLRLVTDSQDELNSVFKELSQISKETRTPLDANVESYRRLGVAVKEMGIPAKDLLAVQKSINQALIISGAGAQEARAGLIQFAQGLASNRLQGDELRSVLENVPRLAQAIAKGMGVTVGEIRDLASEGKLTSKELIRAIQSQADVLEEEFAKVLPTIGQALVLIRNEFLVLIRTFNNFIPVGNSIALVLKLIADNLLLIIGTSAIAGIGKLTQQFLEYQKALAAVLAAERALVTAEVVEDLLVLTHVLNSANHVFGANIFAKLTAGAGKLGTVLKSLPALLAAGVGSLATLFRLILNNPFTWLALGIYKVIEVFGQLTGAFDGLGKKWRDTVDGMKHGWVVFVQTLRVTFAVALAELDKGFLTIGVGFAYLMKTVRLMSQEEFDAVLSHYGNATREIQKDLEKIAADAVNKMNGGDMFKGVTGATDAANEAAGEYLTTLLKQLESTKDNVAALRLVVAGEAESLEIAKLIVEQRKFNTDEINKGTAELIAQKRIEEELNEILKVRQQLKDLRSDNEAVRLVLTGQAESLEIAKLQIAAKNAQTDAAREEIEQIIIEQREHDKLNKQLEIQKQIASEVSGAFGDMFKSLIDGSKSFRESLSDLAAKLADTIFQLTVIKPLQESILGGLQSSAGGGGSFLGSLFGSFRKGGYSTSPPELSHVPVSAFRNAPQFARGTPNTGGFPAILHPGEAVVPLSGGRSIPVDMAGGGNNITIAPSISVKVEGGSAGAGGLNDDQARKMGVQISESVSTEIYRIINKEVRPGGVLAQVRGN